jgi:hypothetical protein
MQVDIEKRVAARRIERQFDLPDAAMRSGGSGGDEVRGREGGERRMWIS